MTFIQSLPDLSNMYINYNLVYENTWLKYFSGRDKDFQRVKHVKNADI